MTLRFVGVALAEILDVQAREGLGAEVPVDLRITVGAVRIPRQHRQPPGVNADGRRRDHLLEDVQRLNGTLVARGLQHGLPDRVIRPADSGREPLAGADALVVGRVQRAALRCWDWLGGSARHGGLQV